LTGRGGWCLLDNLPPEAPLSAEAQRAGETLHRESGALVLQPGEQRELQWSIGSGSELRGWVTDQDGRPVARRELWLTQTALNAGSDRERFYFSSGDEREIVARTRTDTQGAFSFADVGPGTWFVGPSIRSTWDGPPDVDGVAPVAIRVEVPAGGMAGEVELHVTRGQCVRGRITFPGSEPPSRVSVSSYSELGTLIGHVDGLEFILGPLEPVPHEVRAGFAPGYTASEAVAVEGGQEDVLLELGRGGRLAGHFVDGRSGERCEAAIVISSADSGHLSMGLRPKPDFDLTALKAGTYDLAASTPAGLAGVLRGVAVKPGSSREGLEIRLGPGAKLRVRYTGPETYVQYRILHEGAIVAANGLRSGTGELNVVPAGTNLVRVTSRGSGGKRTQEREVTLAEGEEAEAAFTFE